MAGPKSLQLRAYLGFARLSPPLWRLAMGRRVRAGKEDPARVREKFGQATLARPRGRLIWFHALSVGESLALLALLERAGQDFPEMHFLLTTSTRSSAQALEKIGLPARTLHQFLPVDTFGAVRKFLNHWQPEAVIFSELDFWPVMMSEVKSRALPLLLINCRMSAHNFAKRRRGGALFGDLLAMFDTCLLQEAQTRRHLAKFGVPAARMRVLGALKVAARPLPADPETLAQLAAQLAGRGRWLAAATEIREDETILRAHQLLVADRPDALLILAPRHPDVAARTEALARKYFPDAARVARRGCGQIPGPETQVYIADTIGEMGLWYRLAPVSFIAHSLPVADDALRGKNPYEAAALGSVIVHGPCVSDFSETYAELDAAGAALQAATAEEIAAAVKPALDPGQTRPLTRSLIRRADEIVASKQAVLDQTWAAIREVL